MKVHTVTKANPAQVIADMGAKPITKTQPRTAGLDATMLAMSTVQEILAHVKGEGSFWHGIGKRIILGTTDYRAQLVKQLDASLKEMRAANAQALDGTISADGKPDPGKDAKKIAGGNVAAATVEISRCRTIANAFNGGGSVPGLVEFFAAQGKCKSDGLTLDHVSWTVMHKYASTFSESKAGRKADSWLTKFGKFLEGAGKLPEDADDTTKAQHAAAVALYNKMVKG